MVAAILFVMGSLVLIGCAALAYFTDHEAAGTTGCMKEGQVW